MELGDKVRLRSGGPEMTVTAMAVPCDGNVWCSWDDEDGPTGAAFNIACLEMRVVSPKANNWVLTAVECWTDEEPKQETWRDRPPLF